jgi:hypothetical protein
MDKPSRRLFPENTEALACDLAQFAGQVHRRHYHRECNRRGPESIVSSCTGLRVSAHGRAVVVCSPCDQPET